jgi:hypothetical protein
VIIGICLVIGLAAVAVAAVAVFAVASSFWLKFAMLWLRRIVATMRRRSSSPGSIATSIRHRGPP